MKLIVAGSREFENYAVVERSIDQFIENYGPISEIVSGGARGADQLGERYAKKHKIALRQFYPNWDLYGKSAGYRRNEQMANYGNALLAFWDGLSRGTMHMRDLARARHLLVVVQPVKLSAAELTVHTAVNI